MNKTLLSILSLCCALCVLGACNGKGADTPPKPAPTCETMIDKMLSCSKKEVPAEMIEAKKKEFIAECKADQAIDPKAYDAILACADVSDCKEAEKCARDAEKAFDKAAMPIKIRKDIAEKNLKKSRYGYRCRDIEAGKSEDKDPPTPDMIAACKEFNAAVEADKIALINADTQAKKFKDSEFRYDCEKALKDSGKVKASDEFKKACTAFATAWAADLTTTLTKTRDTATADTAFLHTECFELEGVLQNIEGEAGEKKAKALCEEQRIAIDIAKLNAEVGKYIAEKKTTSYFGCKSVVEKIDKLGTDFAKSKRDAVLAKCFIEHGKVVLEVELPDMKSICPFQIKNLIKAVNEHKLAGKDAAFDAALAPALANEKCTQE